MIVLAKKGFTDTGALLRKLSQVDVSARRGRFTEEFKTEILEHLRSLYENERKSFIFALVNSSNGLAAAVQVVTVAPEGLLSKKEQKKMEELNKCKKERQQFRNNFMEKSRSICFSCNKVR